MTPRSRIVADPRRQAAGYIATLESGHAPRLKRTHGADAPCPIFDALVVEFEAVRYVGRAS